MTIESSALSKPSSLESKRRNLFYIAIALLSLVGLADSIYLTVQHITGESVRCTIISGCSEVLSSSYAVIGGYPLASIGAFAYFSVFSLAILAVFGYRVAGQLLLPVVLAMCLVSLWLIYLQAFVIRHFCQFCLLSAGITFTMTVLVLVNWRLNRQKK